MTNRRLQPLRYLHDCSDCFRLERLPGGIFTHWKSAAFARRTPTPDILGAAVVASGRDANRVVTAHIPSTKPRGPSVTLTCYGRSEAADTGSRLQASGSSQFETL